jgi:hypothetical protein
MKSVPWLLDLLERRSASYLGHLHDPSPIATGRHVAQSACQLLPTSPDSIQRGHPLYFCFSSIRLISKFQAIL